jgi:hypothetical protein
MVDEADNPAHDWAADEEFQRAGVNGVRYLEPAGLGVPKGRRTRLPSEVGLAESYATQQHAWQEEGQRVILRPLDHEVPVREKPPGGPTRYLIAASNPLGRLCTARDNLRLTERLRARLTRCGADVERVVTTLPPGRGWYEDTFCVSSTSEPAMRELALELGQPAFTVWTDAALRVVPTGLVEGITSTSRGWELVTLPRTCPMRGDDHASDRCTMRGGPWISASITAAAIWTSHRAGLVRGLGCDACADGTRPFAGPLGRARGVIPLRDVVVASRYGGYVWP